MTTCKTVVPSVVQIRNQTVPIRRVGFKEKTLISLGYEDEEEYLRSVIKQAVVGNRDGVKVSTSIMVYGSPGCGKSQVVDKAIQCIGDEYGQDAYDLVTLDGKFCFSLQDSIMEICDQILGNINELGLDADISDTTPFDERLESILAYLQDKLVETKKSLIVVIDGIEKFVDDSSQRLLYNLFDISANATFSVPICIIGITPCVDILDSFEKRVRSRFSHRQINLIPKIEFTQYQEWAKALLSLSRPGEWNVQMTQVLQDKEVTRILRLLYDADKSIGQLRRLIYVASLQCEEDDVLTCKNIIDAYSQLFGLKCYVQMALDLPISELVVLLGIYKKIQRSLQAWQPSEVYEIVKHPYSLYQLRKDDFVKTMIKFQNMHLIIAVGGSQQNRCVSNLFESYFKCELSYTEFQDIWKSYPDLPSFFNEYL